MPMKRPEDDVEVRTPVWDSLQMFFMDTDPADFLQDMAEVCAKSPYSEEEIEAILFNEVLPACRFNFIGVAPVWEGFETSWLVERILKKHRFGRGRPFLLRRYTTSWWKWLKPLMAARQSAAPSA